MINCLAALLGVLEFLEFLTSSLGLSIILGLSLYCLFDSGLGINGIASLCLAILLAFDFYNSLNPVEY